MFRRRGQDGRCVVMPKQWWDKPAREGQLVCGHPGCQRGVWWTGKGTPGRYCPEHAKGNRDWSDASKYQPRMDEPHTERGGRRTRAAIRAMRQSDALKLGNVIRMAAGLSFSSDPAEAAAAGGVVLFGEDGKPRQPTSEELEALANEAVRDEFGAVRELRGDGLANMLRLVAFRNAASMLEDVDGIKPESRAFVAKMLQGVDEALGGKRLSYPKITINFGQPTEPAADED